MGLIENYIDDLGNVKDLYDQNWVIPFGSAYTMAHAKFKETLKSQEEWDKMKVELFLTAATIGFGAGMGAMFGKAAVGSVVVDGALSFVCNRNMTRTFNAMASISSSVPGTFIVQQVWDTVSSKVGDAAKAQVIGLFQTPAPNSGIQEPQVIQNDLKIYVLKAKTAAHAVAADLRDNRAISQAEKDDFATKMRAAPFFAKAPTRDLVGNRQDAANIIELGFYMVMVMDSDYMTEQTVWQQGARDGIRTRKLGPVTLPTTDSKYGKAPPMKFSYGPGYANTTSTHVSYASPGSRILDRINDLYMGKFKKEFFPNGLFDFETYGRAEVTRAEDTMSKLNELVLGMKF
ncbi:hypothetical protein RNZ50_12405 [Paracoccaceae bacterium Fryx2]|nr:hypothetical protein [Paracoccaceae bacterium Fryx2]